MIKKAFRTIFTTAMILCCLALPVSAAGNETSVKMKTAAVSGDETVESSVDNQQEPVDQEEPVNQQETVNQQEADNQRETDAQQEPDDQTDNRQEAAGQQDAQEEASGTASESSETQQESSESKEFIQEEIEENQPEEAKKRWFHISLQNLLLQTITPLIVGCIGFYMFWRAKNN